MKKYLCLFVLCLFSFCFGIVFADEVLVAQTTVVKAGNLTFQIPAGFVKEPYLGYKRQSSDAYNIEYINIQAFPKDPNWSDEQVRDYLKKVASDTGRQTEEININGKNILIEKSVAGVSAQFCENGMLYMIMYTYMNRDMDYNIAKSFVMNLIRTAR